MLRAVDRAVASRSVAGAGRVGSAAEVGAVTTAPATTVASDHRRQGSQQPGGSPGAHGHQGKWASPPSRIPRQGGRVVRPRHMSYDARTRTVPVSNPIRATTVGAPRSRRWSGAGMQPPWSWRRRGHAVSGQDGRMGAWNTFVEGDNLDVLATLDAGLRRPGLHRPAVQHRQQLRVRRRLPQPRGLGGDDAAAAGRRRARCCAATGAIFVSIDDHEVAHLRLLMDDVFGEANLLATVVVNLNAKGRQLGKGFATSHEYLLVYARDAGELRARRDVHRRPSTRPTSRSPPTTAGGSATCRCATPTRSSTPPPPAPCTSRCTATRRPARSAPTPFEGAEEVWPVFGDGRPPCGAGRGRSSTSGPTTWSAARSPAATGPRVDVFQRDWLHPVDRPGAAARSCAPSGSPRRSAPPTPRSRS